MPKFNVVIRQIKYNNPVVVEAASFQEAAKKVRQENYTTGKFTCKGNSGFKTADFVVTDEAGKAETVNMARTFDA